MEGVEGGLKGGPSSPTLDEDELQARREYQQSRERRLRKLEHEQAMRQSQKEGVGGKWGGWLGRWAAPRAINHIRFRMSLWRLWPSLPSSMNECHDAAPSPTLLTAPIQVPYRPFALPPLLCRPLPTTRVPSFPPSLPYPPSHPVISPHLPSPHLLSPHIPSHLLHSPPVRCPPLFFCSVPRLLALSLLSALPTKPCPLPTLNPSPPAPALPLPFPPPTPPLPLGLVGARSASLDLPSWSSVERSMQSLSVVSLQQSAQQLCSHASEQAETAANAFRSAALQSPMGDLRAKLESLVCPSPAPPSLEGAGGKNGERMRTGGEAGERRGWVEGGGMGGGGQARGTRSLSYAID